MKIKLTHFAKMRALARTMRARPRMAWPISKPFKRFINGAPTNYNATMTIQICRMCKTSELVKFLDLGCTPPADQFKREEQLQEPDIYYPLDVFICEHCGLAQLGHVVSPEILY